MSPVRVACLASRAVCVAVEIGSSASVQSFGLLESEASAIRIISQLAGVTPVVSVGKRIFVILRRDYTSSKYSSTKINATIPIIDNKRIS